MTLLPKRWPYLRRDMLAIPPLPGVLFRELSDRALADA